MAQALSSTQSTPTKRDVSLSPGSSPSRKRARQAASLWTAADIIQPSHMNSNPALEKLWRALLDNKVPGDHKPWKALLNYASQTGRKEDDVEEVREIFRTYLRLYPGTYGEWSKYARYELKRGDYSDGRCTKPDAVKNCEEVISSF